ncbi:hypothetical protein [Egicoccus sp. AB-alg6-2]|uniref:hypothetical protein n=1 Tax=Egicoccus sp. AB-alg6-2 TaxID=3242692 RepID=UPI00359ECEF5
MRLRQATAAAAAAVLLAACGGAADESDPEAAPGTDEDATTADPSPDDPAAQPDLPDPEEFITDGEFRGQGVVLPLPDGWSVDEIALLQGLVVAVSDDDASQQLAAQAVDASALSEQEEVEFDDLLEMQRTQFEQLDADIAPTVDEAIEIEGAEQAHRLRFEDVALPDQPEFWLDLILADNGDGRIALFNYAAPSDSFDESIADLMLEGAGIDPDSEPPAPQPMMPEEGLGEEPTGDEPAGPDTDGGEGDDG